MAVVANEDGDLMMEDPLSQEDSTIVAEDENGEGEEEELEMEELKVEDDTEQPEKSSDQGSRGDPGLRKEMETCFGFDDVRSTLSRKINSLLFPLPYLFYFTCFVFYFAFFLLQ